jgi:surface carbohydrate biosynthesis protein
MDVIAFISQWSNNDFMFNEIFYSSKTFFEQTDHAIFKFLKDYAIKNNKKIMIIPRHAMISNEQLFLLEKAYYRELLGAEPEYLAPIGLYPSYHALDDAEVIISADSTLGYESIARGNKTAVFSIRSTLVGLRGFSYGWPGEFQDQGPFWTNHADPDVFNRILDYLFSVNDSQWKKDIEESGYSSLMVRDPGNSVFRSILEKELIPPKDY